MSPRGSFREALLEGLHGATAELSKKTPGNIPKRFWEASCNIWAAARKPPMSLRKPLREGPHLPPTNLASKRPLVADMQKQREIEKETRVDAPVYACMYVCMRVCTYGRARVFMHACACVRVRVRTYARARVFFTRVRTRASIRKFT